MVKERVSWKAFEYEYAKKSTDWFWYVGLIGFASGIISIIFNNLLFGIFLIIGTMAIILQSLRKPEKKEYGISTVGIHVEDKVYPFETIESFWVDETEMPKVLFKSEKLVMPLISVPLGDENPEEIKEVLYEFLDEERLQEPLIQKVAERLGF